MKRAEILEEARKCVCGEREQEYGTPENNFTLIGKLWEAYTGHPFSAKDVAMMLALLKVARIKTGVKGDSFVDLAGYAACAGEIATQTCERCGNPIPESQGGRCFRCHPPVPVGTVRERHSHTDGC